MKTTGTCAKCGNTDSMKATVWVGSQMGLYCHETKPSCYERATQQGYVELREEGGIR